MKFRTPVQSVPTSLQLTHSDNILLIGSCFSNSMGEKLLDGKMRALINPAGTVYNPSSVATTLRSIISGKVCDAADLDFHNGLWLSFDHYTDFSGNDHDKVLEKINERNRLSAEFLSKAKALFITFGTARIFRLKSTGRIVSNCHKLPAGEFTRELLTSDQVATEWTGLLDTLAERFPGLRIIFTISPVRHLKDGAHGNLVSKSTLCLAIEKLLEHHSEPMYFPAYEIFMDDLRDYRFYSDDMIHPSTAAVEYVWEAFATSFLGTESLSLWTEASRITRAAGHRLNTSGNAGRISFAENILRQIGEIGKKAPGIDFSRERDYFLKLKEI